MLDPVAKTPHYFLQMLKTVVPDKLTFYIVACRENVTFQTAQSHHDPDLSQATFQHSSVEMRCLVV